MIKASRGAVTGNCGGRRCYLNGDDFNSVSRTIGVFDIGAVAIQNRVFSALQKHLQAVTALSTTAVLVALRRSKA